MKKIPDVLHPYNDIVDHLTNFDLYINWLDVRIPYEQIISWATILVIGSLAWWMARYVAKNL